jgi:hypothetical protein
MFVIKLCAVDEDTQVVGQADKLEWAVSNAWGKLRCDFGPLSGTRPRDFEELADRVDDAYGGDYLLIWEKV